MHMVHEALVSLIRGSHMPVRHAFHTLGAEDIFPSEKNLNSLVEVNNFLILPSVRQGIAYFVETEIFFLKVQKKKVEQYSEIYEYYQKVQWDS